jgi:hypothetical protein
LRLAAFEIEDAALPFGYAQGKKGRRYAERSKRPE